MKSKSCSQIIKDSLEQTIEVCSASLCSNPIVSVALLTFNHEPYIREALDSILEQECDFELIVGDDCSTDGTIEILRDYQERFPDRIKLLLARSNLYQRHNTLWSNLLRILLASRAPYVALLEGDDYWTDPLKLKKQYEMLSAHPGAICCHHWHTIVREKGIGGEGTPRYGDGYWPARVSNVDEILSGRMRVKTRTAMYRNRPDLFNNMPAWVFEVFACDVPLSMIMGKIGDFVFLDESMAVYRITDGGFSWSGVRKPLSEVIKREFQWVQMWDYGVKHNGYRSANAASKVTVGFYQKILVKSKLLDFGILYRILTHRLGAGVSFSRYGALVFLRLGLALGVTSYQRITRRITPIVKERKIN